MGYQRGTRDDVSVNRLYDDGSGEERGACEEHVFNLSVGCCTANKVLVLRRAPLVSENKSNLFVALRTSAGVEGAGPTQSDGELYRTPVKNANRGSEGFYWPANVMNEMRLIGSPGNSSSAGFQCPRRQVGL